MSTWRLAWTSGWLCGPAWRSRSVETGTLQECPDLSPSLAGSYKEKTFSCSPYFKQNFSSSYRRLVDKSLSLPKIRSKDWWALFRTRVFELMLHGGISRLVRPKILSKKRKRIILWLNVFLRINLISKSNKIFCKVRCIFIHWVELNVIWLNSLDNHNNHTLFCFLWANPGLSFIYFHLF